MALSAEEILELKKALDTPGAIKDEAYRTWALEQVRGSEDERLQGYAAAGGTRADSAAPVPGELGLKGIIGQESQPDDAEVVAGQLDPRFDLMPQALALQPATTHPGGDEAARAETERAGRAPDVAYAYEPPVSVVQKQLIENPAFLRMLRPSAPPGLDEIGALNSTSPLYQDAANYMWRKTAEAAAQSGRKVYRYSQLPWLWGDEPNARGGAAAGEPSGGVLDQLRLKLGGASKPAVDAANAFVMGVDDTAALGVVRAGQETARPETQLSGGSDTMGVNEATPQQTKDVNRWTAEQSPVAYGGGQVLGMLAPWGIADRVFQGVSKGGRYVAEAIAKTRLGGLAGPAARAVGRAGLDAASGGVAAGVTEAGQQAVDIGAEAAQTGEAPSLDRLAEAGERVKDAGTSGAKWGAGGSLVASATRGGAEHIRDSPRFSSEKGPGAVRRTEPNLDWRLRRTITGPRLNDETKAVVGQAARAGDQPGDILAERIASPIRDVAAADTRKAREGALAERRNYQATAEGSTPQAATHLERMSLEKLRDHHQPQPDGSLRPVDETYRDAQRVFNRHIESVSLEPTKGAIELSPDEAGAFLGSSARYKLIESDIKAAGERAATAPKATIERDSYLKTIKDSRARSAADEEIEASIEDIVGDRTPTAAAYAKAEQQVLRERVEEEAFAEANGSLGEYLKQRGVDKVYVRPAAYDARRTDSIVEGLKDPDLIEAAKYDRQQFRKGGERGGYELLRRGQEEKIAKAEKVEKRVAPDGDAFGPVAGLYNSRPGEKQLVDDVRALADRAGVRQQLDQLRGLQETQAIANRSNAIGPTGSRNLWSPATWLDVGQLHAFPVLKALEGPIGPLGAGKAGRAALVGQDAAAPAGEPSARSRYEAARDRKLKELAAERDDEKEKRDRRRARRAAGR